MELYRKLILKAMRRRFLIEKAHFFEKCQINIFLRIEFFKEPMLQSPVDMKYIFLKDQQSCFLTKNFYRTSKDMQQLCIFKRNDIFKKYFSMISTNIDFLNIIFLRFQ